MKMYSEIHGDMKTTHYFLDYMHIRPAGSRAPNGHLYSHREYVPVGMKDRSGLIEAKPGDLCMFEYEDEQEAIERFAKVCRKPAIDHAGIQRAPGCHFVYVFHYGKHLGLYGSPRELCLA